MLGVFILNKDSPEFKAQIASLDKATRDWEMKAARGECSWVCPDCSTGFAKGMPDICIHGHQGCTDIIQRDKATAKAMV